MFKFFGVAIILKILQIECKDSGWIPRLTVESLDGYSLVSRIPFTSLYRFSFYRDVSVLAYSIPEDVEEARFFFKAHEDKLNFLGGKCYPQDIDIHLKHGGLPIVNPANVSFPKDFLSNDIRGEITSIFIQSDESNNTMVIQRPLPGDWFGIAFGSWKDPLSDKIEQQGIAAVCDTVLYTDLRIIKANVSIISCDENITFKLNDNSLNETKDLYKCFLNDDKKKSILNITVIPCDVCKWAVISVQAGGLPNNDRKHQLAECAIVFNDTSSQNIFLKFSQFVEQWHYLEVSYGSEEAQISNYSICQNKILSNEIRHVTRMQNLNISVIELVRDTKSEYFTFEYNLPPNVNEDTSSLVNLTSGNVTVMKFNIFPIRDIGGTLSIGATLKMDMKYYMGYKRNATNSSHYYFSEKEPFFKVVVCASIGTPYIPNINETCTHNNIFEEATIVVNTTDSDSVSNIIHIPYPEIGVWYLTLAVFCDRESACPCQKIEENNSTKYIVKSDKSVYNGTELWLGSEKCNASVVFSVSSAPCLGKKCGVNGACNFYMSGGVIFSSCQCKGRYRGWDCSDTSNITPRRDILMSVLFLTLSNLLFIPSVLFAIRRKYLTEALVYFFTMFFSTFYHACDVVDLNYSFCIVRLGVLQYCDFFCGLLSFWVTLVAMASLNNKVVSFLHMFGAVMIAFGTELDKQALLVFLVPVIVGVCVVMSAWMCQCKKTRKIFPAKAYLIVYLPLGVTLACVGLICYAFLQTNANYHIVHSIWHMIIALSVLCLLPNRAYFIPKS